MPADGAAGDVLALPEADTRPAAPTARRWPLVPLAIVALFALGALLAPWVSPMDPQEQSLRNRFRPPVWEAAGSWQRPLGTDRLGRDLLSRILWGSRVSL